MRNPNSSIRQNAGSESPLLLGSVMPQTKDDRRFMFRGPWAASSEWLSTADDRRQKNVSPPLGVVRWALDYSPAYRTPSFTLPDLAPARRSARQRHFVRSARKTSCSPTLALTDQRRGSVPPQQTCPSPVNVRCQSGSRQNVWQ